MTNATTIQAIFWDFDGVLLESNTVRELGFRLVLKEYPDHEVEQLLTFHRENGGLSRYVKFRHFYEVIRKETLTDNALQDLAQQFSDIMLEKLTDKVNLIDETVNFVKANTQNYPMHIVSGSDGKELNFLCQELGIHHHFQSIEGSPTPKVELVQRALQTYTYEPNACVLIGDSINDFEAAEANGLHFLAYNNPQLNHLSTLDFPLTS